MSRRFLCQIRNQWAGFLALFLVLTGGTAWALTHNSVGPRQIKPNAVHKSEMADNAVGSSEVTNRSLRGVDFAPGLDADTVDGKNAAQLASGRIHAVGNEVNAAVPLVPGLSYNTYCSGPGAIRSLRVTFHTEDTGGTVNGMIVASGIENGGYNSPDAMAPADGAQNLGYSFSGQVINVETQNGGGEAAAEAQLIIDIGARTYSVALHMYQRSSDGYCEAFGTATLAS